MFVSFSPATLGIGATTRTAGAVLDKVSATIFQELSQELTGTVLELALEPAWTL